MTGHLVFSTLHTNDAASAINRLLDLGVNKGILASSLSMVIAQRLVRKICTNCCDHVAPTDRQIAAFRRHGIAPPEQLAVPVGCDSCYKAGYRGRTGIYEVIRVDKKIQSLIFAGALQSTIEEAAVEAGTNLMLKQALKKAASGVTSFEEVYRVVADA